MYIFFSLKIFFGRLVQDLGQFQYLCTTVYAFGISVKENIFISKVVKQINLIEKVNDNFSTSNYLLRTIVFF